MKAQIRIENKIPYLYINGAKEIPMMFFSNTEIGKDDVCEKQVRMAADNNIHIYSVCSHLPVWQSRGKRDFSAALKALDLAIRNDPESKILLRLNVSVYGKLACEWEKTHPGDSIKFAVDCEMMDDGTNTNYAKTAVTLSSDDWMDAAKDALDEFNDIIKTNEKYDEHLMGYHIAAGETGEWFHCSIRERGIDFSETNRKKYCEYLKKRYERIEDLCDSWELKQGTYKAFNEIQIPADMEGNDRSFPASRTLFTSTGDQRFVDYSDYSSEIVSDRILEMAAFARKITKGNKLIVFFYGYYFDLYDARTGHFRVEKILKSSDIDAFSSPICYTDRNEGGVGALMSAVNSFTRAGKLWFVENDLRTCLCLRDDDLYDWVPPIGSIEKLIQVYRREFSHMATFKLGCWYMDLLGRGWQYHPDIWKEISNLKSLYASLEDALVPQEIDVAVIVDEKAMSYVAHAQALGINLIYNQRLGFYRAGVRFGFFTSSDYENSQVKAKLVVYMNPFDISDERTDKINRKLSGDGSSVLFMHGFGNTSSENIAKLCGFEIKRAGLKMYNLGCVPHGGFNAKEESLLEKTISDKTNEKKEQRANPASYIEPENFFGVTLATYKHDSLAGKIGIAYMEKGYGKVFFSGPMCLTPDSLREICRIAGVNIYSESNDTFFGNGNILSMHTSTGGEKTLRLEKEKNIKEIFTGKVYKNTKTLKFDSKKHTTYTFILE